ncbi:MAG: DeoR/GlpR family DNA-binding transcription regulator [Lachnospiraceae bacterium]
MLTRPRQDEILRLVNTNKSASVQELTELLDASESTIRRDIIALDAQGKLTKVFGGAVALETNEPVVEPSMKEKVLLNIEQKREIAKIAANLIEQQDFVFIDAGSTTECMIDYITQMDATFVTNAISHAQKLAQKGLQVLLIGGMLKPVTEAIVGSEAVLNLQKYHFTKCFMGTNGVDELRGCTTPDIKEASIKQVVIQNTLPEHRYLLADASKFGTCSGVTFASLEEMNIIK